MRQTLMKMKLRNKIIVNYKSIHEQKKKGEEVEKGEIIEEDNKYY